MNDPIFIARDDVLNNMSEGLMILNERGIIEFVNPAAGQLLGFSQKDLLGANLTKLYWNQPENDDFLQAVLDTYFYQSKRYKSVIPYQREDEELTFRIVASVLKNDEDVAGIILIIEDLSELQDLRDTVKAMRKIEALNQQLEMRNKLLNETFGRFLSDDIVKELLDTPGGLELGGKKQYLTMMMSDLRGFTAISEKMDPADLVTMLNHYLGEMTDVIQKRNGTIIEFIGDGIMVLFGAPAKDPSHADNAVAAAIEMENAMAEVNRWNLERGFPLLEMGIGIVTGEVIVGNIGSDKRMKYGVVGSSVNLCGRIESYTFGNQILISPGTREACGAPLRIEREMTVLPKGEEEIVLSQVTGIGKPYGISMKTGYSSMKDLYSPIPVCFYKLDAKLVVDKACYGGIVSIGHDSALLDTCEDVQLLDNLCFPIGEGKLFCKVVDDKEGHLFLHYTYIPAEYEDWYAKQIRIRRK